MLTGDASRGASSKSNRTSICGGSGVAWWVVKFRWRSNTVAGGVICGRILLLEDIKWSYCIYPIVLWHFWKHTICVIDWCLVRAVIKPGEVLSRGMSWFFRRCPAGTYSHQGDQKKDASSRKDDIKGTSFWLECTRLQLMNNTGTNKTKCATRANGITHSIPSLYAHVTHIYLLGLFFTIFVLVCTSLSHHYHIIIDEQSICCQPCLNLIF